MEELNFCFKCFKSSHKQSNNKAEKTQLEEKTACKTSGFDGEPAIHSSSKEGSTLLHLIMCNKMIFYFMNYSFKDCYIER